MSYTETNIKKAILNVATKEIFNQNAQDNDELWVVTDENATFIHNQAIPLATWNIEHNLDKFPSITVVDSAGNVVQGDYNYPDRNHCVLTFNAPFTGKAYLN